MINLEQITAEYAQKITQCIMELWPQGNLVEAGKADNFITKALGILQESGIYALMVYSLSKANSKDTNGRYTDESTCYIYIVESLLALLGDSRLNLGLELNPSVNKETVNDNKARILNHISNQVTDTVDRVLIAHKLLEQTLIFARYGAKALG